MRYSMTSTARKDLSYVTCFNCEKKGHYAMKFSEPRKKTSDSFNNLHFDDWSSLLL